jgi:hypothetical protein
MPPTPEQIKLIRDYEPVLFFHGGDATTPAERFFPSDAKRYLEQCALWKATAPFATRADWGATPVIGKGKIGAPPNEGSEFLGKGLPNGPFDYLETPADKECFLEMTGWKPVGTPFPPPDRYADLDPLANRYATEPGLNASQFWYHAEFFDVARLRGLFHGILVENEANPDFMQLLTPHPGKPALLTAPALICYYLFYPGHDEALSGCQCQRGQGVRQLRRRMDLHRRAARPVVRQRSVCAEVDRAEPAQRRAHSVSGKGAESRHAHSPLGRHAAVRENPSSADCFQGDARILSAGSKAGPGGAAYRARSIDGLVRPRLTADGASHSPRGAGRSGGVPRHYGSQDARRAIGGGLGLLAGIILSFNRSCRG